MSKCQGTRSWDHRDLQCEIGCKILANSPAFKKRKDAIEEDKGGNLGDYSRSADCTGELIKESSKDNDDDPCGENEIPKDMQTLKSIDIMNIGV